VPTVAWVLGFAIVFFYDDHGEPHFHVKGKGTFAKIMLADLSVAEVKGELSVRELREIRSWARRHLPELYQIWSLARAQRPFGKIED
jgi:uncharacterized membrane protein YbhN (UPF0104 family)